MKRFLKNDRYKLDDWEKENLWQGIRQELKPRTGPGIFRRSSLRPALTAAVTVASLTVAALWWTGDQRTDPVATPQPVMLAEGPSEVSRRAEKSSPGVLAEIQSDDVAIMELDAVMEELPSTVPSEEKAAAQAGVSLTGRVVDRVSGECLPFASVMIRGTNRGVVADSTGVFHLENLVPGQDITLVVMMLSYAPHEQVVAIPAEGPFEYAFNLEPEIVETLEAFDVEGAEYRAEVKSAVTEHTVSSKTFEKYSIDSADDALSKKSGVVMRAGELHERDAAAPDPRTNPEVTWGSGSVTGGTKPPNGEEVELMYFDHTGVNPFIATEDDSLSTFAIDVDTASWTVARNYLSRGILPPKEAIRVEEFVNAFDPGWDRNTDEVFRLHSDGSVSRFGDGYHLLRVGVVGKTVEDKDRKAANLIFVIDISGSMNRENRLGAVKKSLHILLDELGEGDRVGLVVYGSQGEIRLEPTDISRRKTIEQAIDGLISNGSTNVHEGLDLAYGLARKYYEPAKINRLILCSDGVANNGGSTEAEEILSLVRKASDGGITISAIGFGMGNYNDVLMEKLANKGDGNYYYVDKQEEAERVFKENLTGLLQTIAREVKVQVAFDPERVQRWRLLGYENRDVADRDFRNDAVDAGEVGAGHQVTALYEVKLADIDDADDTSDLQIGTFRLRHEAPTHDTTRAGMVEEIEQPILLGQLDGDFADGTVWMRAQIVAAEFAEILRGSYWARESQLADLVPVADGLAAEMPGDPTVRDLADMIRKAADLQAGGNSDAED